MNQRTIAMRIGPEFGERFFRPKTSWFHMSQKCLI